ncbi:MAG TPA: GNAT family protein [Solirubrobacterales bacterium]|nr:GNAT family protein [Solirubrobacterales bacterium]
MPVLPETLTLSGSSVLLRDWREDDAPVLEAVCGEWDVCQFTSVPWSYSLADATNWVVRNREKRSRGEVLSLAIAATDRSPVVGNVNLTRFSADGREAALGYWLVPGARGRGLASAAALTLAGWGFEVMGLGRIELAILPENAASHRVAERLGATSEGLRRGSHEAGGRRWDMEIYALYP